MIFAQIKGGVIQNTIVLDDASLESLFGEGYDYFLRIDDLDPMPGVDCTYDSESNSFSLPPDPTDEEE